MDQTALHDLVIKKINDRGVTLEQIAEEVEEPVDAIRELYDRIKAELDATK